MSDVSLMTGYDLYETGIRLVNHGDVDDAASLAARHLTDGEVQGNTEITVYALCIQGYILFFKGRIDEATDVLKKAESLAATVDDRLLQAQVARRLAFIHMAALNANESRKYAQFILDTLSDDMNDPVALGLKADAFGTLAHWHAMAGEKSAALSAANDAWELANRSGDNQAEIDALHAQGNASLAFGKRYKALDYYRQAQGVQEAIGDQLNQTVTLSMMGSTYSAMPGYTNQQKAIAAFDRSLEMAETIGYVYGQVATLQSHGLMLLMYHDFHDAQIKLEKCLEISREHGIAQSEYTVLAGLLRIYRRRREFDMLEAGLVRLTELHQTLDIPDLDLSQSTWEAALAHDRGYYGAMLKSLRDTMQHALASRRPGRILYLALWSLYLVIGGVPVATGKLLRPTR